MPASRFRPVRNRTRGHAIAGATDPHLPSRGRTALLGGMTIPAFLRRHWQKTPHLVRGAVPGFTGVVTRSELFALAARDDVESRLVERDGARWSLTHGPFSPRTLRALPKRNWTLLVQGIDLHVPAGDALLRRFAFLPYARLDDLMVSLAAPGGGVGPHLDAYDVFLLQGEGRRRWRYGSQGDASFRPGLPLRILRRFAPAHDDVLGPGDMLYLPPGFAHDGIAVDTCTTYSIGFRAPAASELADAFLAHLQDTLALSGRYADPDLSVTAEPARIGTPMQRKVTRMLADIRWNRATVSRFLGVMLSEPKPTVFFEPPTAALRAAAFRRRVATSGVRLDLRTQFLYDDACFYLNGEVLERSRLARPAAVVLERLANARALPQSACGAGNEDLLLLLHDWYRLGYVHPGTD